MAEQTSWRYCQNCHTMFYDGYGNKGACSTGRHVAQGLNFALPYDGTATAPSQDKWRYCDKCRALLDQFSSEASVFYTIGEEGPNRGKLLMKASGVGE